MTTARTAPAKKAPAKKRAAAKTSPRAAATTAAREQVAAEFDALAQEFDQLITAPDEDGYVPVNDDGTVNPVRIGKRGRTPNPMVDLFELDGVMHQIPEKPSPVLTLKFLREARDRRVGVDKAIENLLLTLLGQDALDALAESPEVTEDDVADVFKIVGHIAFGALKRMREAQGN